MADTDLPWLFLGRKVKPFALAVTIAMTFIAIWLVGLGDDGDVFDRTSLGRFAGSFAALGASFLWYGWWTRSSRVMCWGLLVASGVFAGRAFFLLLDLGWSDTSGWLSLCWMIASGGAYVLEHGDVGRERGRGE